MQDDMTEKLCEANIYKYISNQTYVADLHVESI